jgi:hypothetical protein
MISRPFRYRAVECSFLEVLKRLAAARACLHQFFGSVLSVRAVHIAELRDERIHFG